MTPRPECESLLSPILQEAMAELATWAIEHRSEDVLPSLVGPLYHYTDANGLFGLLEKKEMWFTNSSHLNDPTEITFGRQVAMDVLASHRKPPGEDNASSYLADVMADDAKSRLLGVYIASFSKKANDLGQWRAYGDDGQGVCIEFSPAVFGIFPPSHLRGGAVRYGKDKLVERQSAIVGKALEIFNRPQVFAEFLNVAIGTVEGISVNDIFRPFREMIEWNALFSKHQAYEAEEEIRIVITDNAQQLQDRVKTRVRGGEIIPYIPQELPFMDITRVQLGPAANPRAQDGVHQLLRQHGYADDILAPQSDIPYRSR